ncbi:hypothetical protein MRX96_016100 [Rhipicephalus microplus]
MADRSGELRSRHGERIFSDERKHDEVRTTKRQFTLQNSLWFTMSAIMRKGCDTSPSWALSSNAGSPYGSVLSSTILRLQESGTLQTLKNRWWKVKDPARRCPDDQAASRTDVVSELGLPKVGGVFVVLLAGLGLACLIAFAEFFFKARSSREKRRNASTGASTSGRPVDVSALNALFCFHASANA